MDTNGQTIITGREYDKDEPIVKRADMSTPGDKTIQNKQKTEIKNKRRLSDNTINDIMKKIQNPDENDVKEVRDYNKLDDKKAKNARDPQKVTEAQRVNNINPTVESSKLPSEAEKKTKEDPSKGYSVADIAKKLSDPNSNIKPTSEQEKRAENKDFKDRIQKYNEATDDKKSKIPSIDKPTTINRGKSIESSNIKTPDLKPRRPEWNEHARNIDNDLTEKHSNKFEDQNRPGSMFKREFSELRDKTGDDEKTTKPRGTSSDDFKRKIQSFNSSGIVDNEDTKKGLKKPDFFKHESGDKDFGLARSNVVNFETNLSKPDFSPEKEFTSLKKKDCLEDEDSYPNVNKQDKEEHFPKKDLDQKRSIFEKWNQNSETDDKKPDERRASQPRFIEKKEQETSNEPKAAPRQKIDQAKKVFEDNKAPKEKKEAEPSNIGKLFTKRDKDEVWDKESRTDSDKQQDNKSGLADDESDTQPSSKDFKYKKTNPQLLPVEKKSDPDSKKQIYDNFDILRPIQGDIFSNENTSEEETARKSRKPSDFLKESLSSESGKKITPSSNNEAKQRFNEAMKQFRNPSVSEDPEKTEPSTTRRIPSRIFPRDDSIDTQKIINEATKDLLDKDKLGPNMDKEPTKKGIDDIQSKFEKLAKTGDIETKLNRAKSRDANQLLEPDENRPKKLDPKKIFGKDFDVPDEVKPKIEPKLKQVRPSEGEFKTNETGDLKIQVQKDDEEDILNPREKYNRTISNKESEPKNGKKDELLDLMRKPKIKGGEGLADDEKLPASKERPGSLRDNIFSKSEQAKDDTGSRKRNADPSGSRNETNEIKELNKLDDKKSRDAKDPKKITEAQRVNNINPTVESSKLPSEAEKKTKEDPSKGYSVADIAKKLSDPNSNIKPTSEQEKRAENKDFKDRIQKYNEATDDKKSKIPSKEKPIDSGIISKDGKLNKGNSMDDHENRDGKNDDQTRPSSILKKRTDSDQEPPNKSKSLSRAGSVDRTSQSLNDIGLPSKIPKSLSRLEQERANDEANFSIKNLIKKRDSLEEDERFKRPTETDTKPGTDGLRFNKIDDKRNIFEKKIDSEKPSEKFGFVDNKKPPISTPYKHSDESRSKSVDPNYGKDKKLTETQLPIYRIDPKTGKPETEVNRKSNEIPVNSSKFNIDSSRLNNEQDKSGTNNKFNPLLDPMSLIQNKTKEDGKKAKDGSIFYDQTSPKKVDPSSNLFNNKLKKDFEGSVKLSDQQRSLISSNSDVESLLEATKNIIDKRLKEQNASAIEVKLEGMLF